MRNQTKKAFSLLLALVMCLSCMSVGAFASEDTAVVSTLSDLQTAVNDGSVSTIKLADNIDLGNNSLTIDRAVTIDGQNNSITGTATYVIEVPGNNADAAVVIQNVTINARVRGIHVGTYSDANGGSGTANLKVVNTTIQLSGVIDYDTGYTASVGSYTMGIATHAQSGRIELSNSTIQGVSYDINMFGVSRNTNVSVNGGSLKGRAALNVWGKNNSFTLSGVSVIGLNNQTGPSESFACIVENIDKTAQAENNTYNVENCTFTATLSDDAQTTAGSTATQFMFRLGQGKNSTVRVTGSTYTTNSPMRGGFEEYAESLWTDELSSDITIDTATKNALSEFLNSDVYVVTDIGSDRWKVELKPWIAGLIGPYKGSLGLFGGYASLQVAIDKFEGLEGYFITLLGNVELDKTVNIDKDLTLDLNGCNITGNGVRALHVKQGTLNITGNGIIAANPSNSGSSVIRVGDGDATSIPAAAAELTIGKDVTVQSDTCYGVTIFGSNGANLDSTNKVNNTDAAMQKLTVYGTVSVSGETSAISGNGNWYNAKTDIQINEGAVVSATNAAGIYHPQAGNLTINGSVTGPTAIEMKSGVGTVAVSGNARIEATGSIADSSSNNNGTSSSGYAIVAVENKSYKGGGKVYIDGGTFIGPVGIVVDEAYDDADVEKKPVVLKSTGYTGNLEITADYKWSDEVVENSYYKLVARPVAQIAAVAAVEGTTLMSLKQLITSGETSQTSENDVTNDYSMTATSKDIKIVKDEDNNNQISIPAKDMGALITFTNNEGEVKNLKMETYLNEIIKESNDEAAVTNAKATLDYGIAASRYFNTSMVTKDYSQTEEVLEAAKDALAEETSTFTAPNQDADSPFKFIGVSLLLDGATTLRLNFQGDPNGQTVSYGNVQYTYQGETYSVNAINHRNADYYYIDVKTNIAPGDLGETVSVIFDGEPITVSAVDYCKLAINQDDDALVDLATALYRCYLVAKPNSN